MKKINRTDWDSIKDLETINGKFKDGQEYRIFKCPNTGLIEIVLDFKDLANQQQDENFNTFIGVNSFYMD